MLARAQRWLGQGEGEGEGEGEGGVSLECQASAALILANLAREGERFHSPSATTV